jgi:small subunit ribosomal protein S17
VRATKRKTLVGTVRSDRRQKTITVEVESRVKHPLYGKYILRRHRFAAHDEKEEAAVGDRVEIMSSRPLSKQKRWRLVRVVERTRRPGESAS